MTDLKCHRTDQSDRRQFNRFDGHGLVAMIGGSLIDVIDVSLTGLRLASCPAKGHGAFDFTLYARTGSKLDLNRGVRVAGTVIRGDDGAIAVHFTRFTYSLAKMIIRHTGATLGVAPHMVR
jgi:hypothetical protein